MSESPALSALTIERRWRGQQHPMPSMLALIRRQRRADPDQFLVIRRVAEPFTGKWALVGGKWDFGETLAAGVCREVEEETGLRAEFVALRGIVSERLYPGHTTPDRPEENQGGHYLLFVCEVRAQGSAREQQEGPLAWHSAPELEEMAATGEMVPTDFLFVERFANAPAIPLHEAELMPEAGQHRMLAFAEHTQAAEDQSE